MTKLENLAQSNERYLQQGFQYAQIEKQILQLKKAMRMSRKLTETVDHLWQVKETEYANINEIIASLEL